VTKLREIIPTRSTYGKHTEIPSTGLVAYGHISYSLTEIKNYNHITIHSQLQHM